MKRRLFILLLVVMMFSVVWAQEKPDDSDWSKWSHAAKIDLVGPVDKGVVEVAIPPEVMNDATSKLTDLRVVNDDSQKEVGYVLDFSRGKYSKLSHQGFLYNRSYIPGKQSSISVRFNDAPMKNRIEIKTSGVNFRRRVKIEASSNGKSWQVIRNVGYLFQIQGDDVRYDKSTIMFPDNDQQYLRLTIFNGIGDPAKIEIKQVTTSNYQWVGPKPLPVKILSSKISENKKFTEIDLDLGFKGQPISTLNLDFIDENFNRGVQVLGRDEIEITRTIRYEDGQQREETRDVPYKKITGDMIYRYSANDQVEQSLDISLSGAQYRYLMVRIDNRDDPPLTFKGATVNRLYRALYFQAKQPGSNTLYFGRKDALSPKYDLVHYLDRLKNEGVTTATLSNVGANPIYDAKEKQPQWSEKYSAFIWIILIAVLSVLVFVVSRQFRSIKLD